MVAVAVGDGVSLGTAMRVGAAVAGGSIGVTTVVAVTAAGDIVGCATEGSVLTSRPAQDTVMNNSNHVASSLLFLEPIILNYAK
jgi:hypothetical protein